MPLPMFHDYKKLSTAPRRFLVFSVFNVFSWYCLVGPVLILFARFIEMPVSWVGYLNSTMPLSMIFVVVSIPLVTRLGYKKILVLTWFLRCLVACGVFLIPWVQGAYGSQAAWFVFLGSIVGFCLIRSVGVGGWFPWLHEVVPEKEQSRFFSTEMAIAQSCIVIITLVQAFILKGDVTIGRFMLIYTIGVGSGIISTFWLARVPGGKSTHNPEEGDSSFASYAVALKDRSYMLFVITTCLCFSCMVFLESTIVLYMRDGLGYSDMPIMVIMAAGGFVVLLSIHFWSRFADHSGTSYAMLLAILGHSFAALMFLVLLPDAAWTKWLLPPVLVMTVLMDSAYWSISHHHMMGVVEKEHKVGYTNIWIVGSAISMGLTPIATGYIIEHLGLMGFRIAFVCSGVGGIVCGLANYWVVHHRKPLKHSLSELINPSLPIRTLARIAWVSVGLDESNRKADGNPPKDGD